MKECNILGVKHPPT